MQPNLPQSFSEQFFAQWKSAYEKSRKLPCAFLLSGPEGVGKKSCALKIAEHLMGEGKPLALAHHSDYIEVTTEKKSIGIETIRELLHRLTFKPISAPYIIVMIEDAETMTVAAANALLKTLEEPSPYVLFFLLTRAPEQLLLTIRSRSQKIHFPGDINLYQTQSQKLLEQHTFLSELVLPFLQKKKANFSEASKVAEALAKDGHDLPSLFLALQNIWHDALVWKSTGDDRFLTMPPLKNIIQQIAQKDSEILSEEMDLMLETVHAIDGNVNKTLALERLLSALVKN